MAMLLWLANPMPAHAGAPFDTDDPVPVDRGQWQDMAYVHMDSGNGARAIATGLDLTFGVAKNHDVNLLVPVLFTRDAVGARVSGLGPIELATKWRMVDSKSGFMLAIAPRIILPTSGEKFDSGQAGVLLPVLVSQDWDRWTLVGSAGYRINPGPGNRNHFSFGALLQREIGANGTIGVEVTRHGADSIGGAGATRLGLGIAVPLNKDRLSLNIAAGPTFGDDKTTRFHGYAGILLTY